MKTIAPVLSLLVLALAASPAAAQSAVHRDFQSVKVLDADLPIFPQSLIELGVREGEVRVAFSVDSVGKVDDCLALEYTHPEFARVTSNAIRRWRFEPARYRGEPIAAATEVLVRFEVQGTVVVSLNTSETINARMYSILNQKDSYRMRSLRELDRIPTPIAAPSPAYPEQLAKTGAAGTVTIGFFIDEDGAVRLPSVQPGGDPALGAAAIDAMRNWKFEPPTCKGRPVLVRAEQKFNFHGVPAPAKSS